MKYVIKRRNKREYLEAILEAPNSFLTVTKQNDAWTFNSYVSAANCLKILNNINDNDFQIVPY